MTLPAINSLANMEYMLYGGASGLNSNTPSYANGYMTDSNLYGNYYNPYVYGNNTQNGQSVYEQAAGGKNKPAAQTEQTVSDWNTLADYYAKDLSPSESLTSAIVMGGAMGALTMHPRLITHPWNSVTTLKEVNDKGYSYFCFKFCFMCDDINIISNVCVLFANHFSVMQRIRITRF